MWRQLMTSETHISMNVENEIKAKKACQAF